MGWQWAKDDVVKLWRVSGKFFQFLATATLVEMCTLRWKSF